VLQLATFGVWDRRAAARRLLRMLSKSTYRNVVSAAICLAIAASIAGVTYGTLGAQHHSAVLTTLAPAAEVTGHQPGYVFKMVLSGEGGGQHVQISAGGTIDARTHQGAFTENVDGMSLPALMSRPYVYVRMPQASAATDGKPWIRVKYTSSNQSLVPGSSGVQSNPVQALSLLTATGHVKVVGHAVVDGAATTEYRAVVDFNHVLTTAPPAERADLSGDAQMFGRLTRSSTFPVDVWIDREDLVRRMQFVIDGCSPVGPMHVSATLDLLRFGRAPVVHVPAPAQFFDITSEVQAQQAQTESASYC
jgi:hypothetical protein